MTPTEPGTSVPTGLTPALVEQVLKLSPDDRDRLRDIMDDEDLPPDDRTDEEIAAEIKRRSDDYHAGKGELLTREESDARIRAAIRKLGYELP